jgi:hypothetical protein
MREKQMIRRILYTVRGTSYILVGVFLLLAIPHLPPGSPSFILPLAIGSGLAGIMVVILSIFIE